MRMKSGDPIDLIQGELNSLKTLGAVIASLGFDVTGGPDMNHIGQLGLMISEFAERAEDKLCDWDPPGQAESPERPEAAED